MTRWRQVLLAWICTLATLGIQSAGAVEMARPNILWLTSEDHGPQMGCYGDRYATTPHVDALAKRGMIYRHCWSNAPVCAAARTTLISGMYATSTGGEHMRSMVPYPAGKQMFPQLLRSAGYYCTNSAKEDYNLSQPGQVWDESSRKAHWRHRKQGQPFFAVFNSGGSHESQIRKRPHKAVHDPAQVRLPAYHPDTPEVRRDWAQYYDVVSEADAEAGAHLADLERAGLSDDTIVFYFADHGPGMPRSKRWPYNSGLQVPLVVYIPEKFAHLRPNDYRAGGECDRLVSFVDFAPTVLSLAGVRPPDWMQGFAFLGAFTGPRQTLVFGFRGRMDEKIDLVRSVTDGRYVYLRNYLPHRMYGQFLAYMFETPTTQVWHRLHEEGKLSAEQDAFWQPKPAEELYDLASDPDEVRNLAGSPEHADVRERLHQALTGQILQVCDLGFLPEGEVFARSADSTPYDVGHDADKYPLERILKTAELAANFDEAAVPDLTRQFEDADSGVRFWAAQGLLIRGRKAVAAAHGPLVAALADPSPYVRITAAEALARFGEPADEALAVRVLGDHADWSRGDVFTAIAALNAIEQLDERAEPIKERLRKLPTGKAPDARYRSYVGRLLEKTPQ